jgi:uncharacterized LabA/DUF88 family protein
VQSRSMLFVDGENLTIRFQEMEKAGRTRKTSVSHQQDAYVWSPQVTKSLYDGLDNVVRVHYYTSATGDEVAITNLHDDISKLGYTSPSAHGHNFGQLVPLVFKKLNRSKKTRNVDIHIIIDVMRYAFNDSIDRIYLASGDGDYLPLIQEVMRRGKQVELLAFSSGLNPALKRSVDRFHLLDDKFFLEDS